jgi:hypothetical protein
MCTWDDVPEFRTSHLGLSLSEREIDLEELARREPGMRSDTEVAHAKPKSHRLALEQACNLR